MKYLLIILALIPTNLYACGADCQRQMNEQIREANQRQMEEIQRRNEQIEQERRMREMLEQSRTYK